VCPTTTPGRIALSVSYDFDADVNPGTIATLLNMKPSTESPNYGKVQMSVPTKFKFPRYPYAGTLGNSDQTVPCTLWFAADNGPVVPVVAGHIYMDVVVEFYNPINPSANP